jgi:hypothetical protein
MQIRNLLIFPMAAYVFYMWALAVYMFRKRVAAIKSGEVGAAYFKTYEGKGPSDPVLVVGQHYDNQFQVPILFLITCAIHMLIDKVNYFTVFLAWAFIATRIAHSIVHLGSNKLPKRVLSFAAGWLVIMILWLKLVIDVLSAA